MSAEIHDTETNGALVSNLQDSNKLIRSRAVVLTLFLILMIGFSLTIEQGKKELQNLDLSYKQLLRVLKTDSMKVILRQDSLAYFYQTNLGAYMSLEVLYDKLQRDSFNNPEPLYAAIDIIDEQYRLRMAEQENRTVSIFGFSTPIRPIMILAPILLLLLYHDFALIMLYRKGLEEKMREKNIDVWAAGPENVGHYMLGFIPYKFRYARWLWSLIQITILFLPIIPAIYFCLYSLVTFKVQSAVGYVDGICCVVILLDFLAIVDSENIFGVRDFALLFTGKTKPAENVPFYKRRWAMTLGVPVIVGLITYWALDDILAEDFESLVGCSLAAFVFTAAMSVFSLMDTYFGTRKFRVLFSAFASGGFFACLFWLVIDLLAFFGAIHFKLLAPGDYVAASFVIFGAAAYAKLIYVRVYLKDLNGQKHVSAPKD